MKSSPHKRKPKAEHQSETDDQKLVVPLVAEEARVELHRTEQIGVRIVKTTDERTETIEVPRIVEQLAVERVERNQLVDSVPPVRQEDDVLVIPVVEEVVVVERRLLLREEVRVRRTQEQVVDTHEVRLRREHAEIERPASPQPPASPDRDQSTPPLRGARKA